MRRTGANRWSRHVGPVFVAFLVLAANASAQAPPSHDDYYSNVPHEPGSVSPFANGCTDCHGLFLGGGIAQSCFTCHWDYDLSGGDARPKDWNIPNFAPNSVPNNIVHNKPEHDFDHVDSTAGDFKWPFATHCTDCHGPNLFGGTGPSCYQCHDDKWNETSGTASPPARDNPPINHNIEKGTGDWHKPGFGTPYIAEPAGAYACSDCHGPNLDDGFAPSCYTCHPRIWAGEGPPLDHTLLLGGVAWHQPGTGDPVADGCTQCHGPNLDDGFAPSCYSCHQPSPPHDFTGQPWLDPADGSCTPCHTWGSSWNHALSSTTNYTVSSTTLASVGDPTGVSAACLGCHEGSPTGPAVDDFQGALSSPPADFLNGNAALGTDLTRHHPVSFTFDSFLATAHGGLNDPSTTASGLSAGGTIEEDMLEAGSLECSACHDPHDNTHGNFRVLPTNEDLCFTCHIRTLPAGTSGMHHIPLRNAPWDRGGCTICHGANLDGTGGNGPACTTCHLPFSYPDVPAIGHHGGDRHQPFIECASCHGDDLQGAAYGSITAPSCNLCHGDVWTGVNQPPVVDPGGPYSGVVGQAVSFDASGTIDIEGNTLSYEWSFGDVGSPVLTSQKPTAAYVYYGAGTYFGSLSVSDGHNASVVVPFSVEISDSSPDPGPESWTVTTTTVPPKAFTATINNHAGALVVIEDDGVNPPSLALGIEFAGVIFWMDVWMDLSGNVFWGTGDMYFGNIDRANGTMSGIVFAAAGGVATFTGSADP